MSDKKEYAEFTGTPEEAESFMNANVELVKSWIVKHVPRKTLESWIAEKRLNVRGSEQHSISIRESTSSRHESIIGNAFEQARQSSRYSLFIDYSDTLTKILYTAIRLPRNTLKILVRKNGTPKKHAWYFLR